MTQTTIPATLSAPLFALLTSVATTWRELAVVETGGEPTSPCMAWNDTAVIGCTQANEALLRVRLLEEALTKARSELYATRTRLASAEQELASLKLPWSSRGMLAWTGLITRFILTWTGLVILVTLLALACLRRVWPAVFARRRRPAAAKTHGTWPLDGLPPVDICNARSLAGQVLADAARGRAAQIARTLAADTLSAEQCATLLGAADLADGNTALMLAAKNGHAATCRFLIARGADVHATNRRTETAADLAKSAGHDAALEVLLASHAPPCAASPTPDTTTLRARIDKAWLQAGPRTRRVLTRLRSCPLVAATLCTAARWAGVPAADLATGGA